jgi:hypothetical protein
MKSWGCILKAGTILAILIIALLVGAAVASNLTGQADNPQQQADAAGTTLEASGELALGIIETVTENDTRTLTYLAQLSDQLNRSWLQQAMPYTVMTIGSSIVAVGLLLAVAIWLGRS